jgi:predicted extracellular nuclease
VRDDRLYNAKESSTRMRPSTVSPPTPPSSATKYELRVGQFNVLNLVKENEFYYGREKYTIDEITNKTEWIAQQLKRMNCCIVGFEEVWHRETLLRATRLSGLYKDDQVYTFNANGSSPTLALASTWPVKEIQEIVDFPKSASLSYDSVTIPITKFSRPIIRAVIELPFHVKVTVFVVHAKSKRPVVADKDRHDQKKKAVGHAISLIVRAAEATALRHILVDELNKDRPVIVIGDLNDGVNSVTTEIITGTQPWKKLPYNQKQKIWDVLLWSTNEVQVRTASRDVFYSHIHNGRYDVLDHVLVSQHFVRSYPKHVGYIQYQQIFNDHLVDETLKDEPRTNIESDHGQVVAAIKLLSETSRLKKRKYDDSDL